MLGKGGFGRTLLARIVVGKVANSRCVIKQVYSVSAGNRDVFRAEAKRLEQLGKHPQIPRLLASVENNLGQFLVQEFAPGQTLEALVASHGSWEEVEVRSLLASLVSVLQYVHSFKVIHRDIKPANIVRGSSASQESLMLVDFGAAKWIGQTAAKTVIGSAGYAAPEQAMGQATFASDIYSLGLTCLHLLTGLHPFDLYSAAEDRWVWQDYLPAPVSLGFAQLLNKMVARSLQARYATMDDVAAGLKAAGGFSLGAAAQTITGAKEWLGRAKGSVLPLQNALKSGAFSEAFQNIVLGQSVKSLPPVVFDLQPWRLFRRIMASTGLVGAISVSPSASIFATAGSDKAIRLWDLNNGELLHAFARKRFAGKGHRATVVDVQFHPDGRALYSASGDGTIKEWDAWERALMNTLPSTGWTPTALAVSADGTTLVNANSDGRIAIWDIATLKVTGQLAQHKSRVNAVAISASGDLLASAGEDFTVRLWQCSRARSPQLLKSLRFESSPLQGLGKFADERQGVVAVALQNMGNSDLVYLVAATRDTVWRYEVTTQFDVRNERVLCRTESAIRAIALSQTGTLAVGTEDRVLRLWRLATGECVAELKHDWGVSAIAFSTDGEALIVASADETLFIWRRETAS